MAYYAKIDAHCVLSNNSDYSEPFVNIGKISSSITNCTRYIHGEVVLPDVVPMTIDLSMFTAISGMYFYNKSVTAGEIVLAQYNLILGYQANGGVNGFTYAEGGAAPDTIFDEDLGAAFITNGAEAGGTVRVVGSTLNDGAYLIQEADINGNLLTLGQVEDLDAEAMDLGSNLWFEHVNINSVPVSGFTFFTGVIQPYADLILRALVGTPSVEYLVVGI